MRYLLAGLYTVNQDERAVKTSFGRAERIGTNSILDDPIAQSLTAEERERYDSPILRVIPPGGPYFKWPWEKIYKVNVSTQTINMAFDPETPEANQDGTVLDAVTKDQLNTGLTGQLRYRVAERNLYAFLFGVRNPITHVMGYFISILRERIANFEAPPPPTNYDGETTPETALSVAGVSINDLRKNLRDLNDHMERECASSTALRHPARSLAHHRHRPASRSRIRPRRHQHRLQPSLLRHQPRSRRSRSKDRPLEARRGN